MYTHELATRAAVNPQTLRYYERRGLLAEPPRTAVGYRSYPEQSVTRVRFIKRAQDLGFTLDEIAELLHLAEGGPRRCESARGLAETRLAGIKAKIRDLESLRDSLQRLVATCNRPHGERECPLLEAITIEARSGGEQEGHE